MIDPVLYPEAHRFLVSLEAREKPSAYGGAALEWAELLQSRGDDAVDYVSEGLAWLVGKADAGGWGGRPRRAELDHIIWTFFRAWSDRYGVKGNRKVHQFWQSKSAPLAAGR